MAANQNAGAPTRSLARADAGVEYVVNSDGTRAYITKYIAKFDDAVSVARDDAGSAPSPLFFDHTQYKPHCAKFNDTIGPCRMRVPYAPAAFAVSETDITYDAIDLHHITHDDEPNDTPNDAPRLFDIVTDYAYGREEQGRGAEHDHCIVTTTSTSIALTAPACAFPSRAPSLQSRASSQP